MARTSLLATALGLSMSLAALAALTPAQAASQTGPMISGGGTDTFVTYGPIPGDTIAGGARAAIAGGGPSLVYSAKPGGQAREGRVGTPVGGGRDQQVIYEDGRPHGWAGTPADIDDRGHRG